MPIYGFQFSVFVVISYIVCIVDINSFYKDKIVTLVSYVAENTMLRSDTFIQGASRETDVFEMDVTEQVDGVEAWVGGS